MVNRRYIVGVLAGLGLLMAPATVRRLYAACETLLSTDATKVAKTGDTMTGNLTLTDSHLTLSGSAGYVASDSSVTASSFFGDGSHLTNIAIGVGAIDTPKLATDAVTADKVINGAIDTNKLANDSVITSKLRTAAVDTNKLSADSVTNSKILFGAVDTLKIANGSVNTTKLSPGAVDTNNLNNDAVTAAKIFKSEASCYNISGGDFRCESGNLGIGLGTGGSVSNKLQVWGNSLFQVNSGSVGDIQIVPGTDPTGASIDWSYAGSLLRWRLTDNGAQSSSLNQKFYLKQGGNYSGSQFSILTLTGQGRVGLGYNNESPAALVDISARNANQDPGTDAYLSIGAGGNGVARTTFTADGSLVLGGSSVTIKSPVTVTSTVTINGGAFGLVAGSTISAGGGTLTISTSAGSGASVSANFSMLQDGKVRFNSGGAQNFETFSSNWTTVPSRSATPFAITFSTPNSTGYNQSVLAFVGTSNTTSLDVSAFSGSSQLSVPTIYLNQSSGSLSSPVVAGGASLNSQSISAIKTRFWDGQASVLRSVGEIRIDFDSGGISTTSPVSLPTNMRFLTTPSGGSAATEACRITSSSTFACGSASIPAGTNPKLYITNSVSTPTIFSGYSPEDAHVSTDDGSLQLGNTVANSGLLNYSANGHTTLTLRNTYADNLSRINFAMGGGFGAEVTPLTIYGSNIVEVASATFVLNGNAPTPFQIGASTLIVNSNGNVTFGSNVVFTSTSASFGSPVSLSSGVAVHLTGVNASVGGVIYAVNYSQIASTTTADTTEVYFTTASIAGNTLARNNDTVRATCYFGMATNGDNKTVRIRVNDGTSTYVIAGQAATANGAQGYAVAEIQRTSSNNQVIQGYAGVRTTLLAGPTVNGFTTTFTDTNTINLNCTGQAGAATQGDISFLTMKVEYLPAP